MNWELHGTCVIQQYREHPELLKRVAGSCRFRPRCEASDGQSSDHGAGAQRRRSARGENILPLSTYKDMFQQAGFAATISQHPELANFYLFVLKPVYTSTGH